MVRIALAAFAAALVMGAGESGAQQPPAAPAPPIIDWGSIQIKTTDLGSRTYMIEGQGGNITVAVGSDAIIMVDGQFAPLSDRIKAAIREIAPLPVRYLVNTHYHGDHTEPPGTTTSPGTAPSSSRTTTSACASPPARATA